MMFAVVPADFDPDKESPRTLFLARETAEGAAALDRAEGLGSRVVAYRISPMDISGDWAFVDRLGVAVPDAPDLLPARPRWGVTIAVGDSPGRVRCLGKIPPELLAAEGEGQGQGEGAS